MKWRGALESKVQYLGGKAGPGARIAQLCSERLTPGALFVDMFCGSLNVGGEHNVGGKTVERMATEGSDNVYQVLTSGNPAARIEP